MKLVVTGHDTAGRSVFSFVGAPPRALHEGSWDLWSTKGDIVVPDATDPEAPPEIGYFPDEGETSFKVVSVPAGLAGLAGPAEGTAGAGAVPRELSDFFDGDDPQMHATDTIDYVIILAGSADLELDDGHRESVAAGDVVVQRGTRHAWRVTGSEPLVLGAVLIGASRR